MIKKVETGKPFYCVVVINWLCQISWRNTVLFHFWSTKFQLILELNLAGRWYFYSSLNSLWSLNSALSLSNHVQVCLVLVHKQLRNYFYCFRNKKDANTPILLLRRHTKHLHFIEFERVKPFVKKKEAVFVENKKETCENSQKNNQMYFFSNKFKIYKFPGC